MPSLLSPLSVGPLTAQNRVFMAPLTRCRAGPDLAPTELNATYYAQRAGAGLIIGEASQVCAEGIGYPSTPGIHTEAQVAGWRRVVDAVHAEGGLIVCQLWHVGRLSHPDFQPGGALPVAPSAINPGGTARTPAGTKPRVVPRPLDLDEIPHVIEQFRHGAACAKRAGFDGVEVHGANGYLPDQFLRDSSNTRTDRYGGSIANRARFLLEVTGAVCDVWGPDRVGVRLSPSGEYSGMSDSTPRETFGLAVRELSRMGIAFLHLMEKLPSSPPPRDDIPAGYFRPIFDGVLIANGGFDYDRAEHYIRDGHADAVSFGTLFISNPDLPRRYARWQRGERVSLSPADQSTFYTPGARGYTDYPFMQ